MGRVPLACAASVGLFAWAAPAVAQPQRVTLAEALRRAREQAPRVISARLAVEEARGRVAGASVRFQNNPELEAAVGRRRDGPQSSTDLDVGVQQLFEPAGRRSARVAAATEAVAQSSAALDEVTRLLLRDTALAFFRTVHAGDRIRLLDGAEQLAVQVFNAADRRFKAGDIAILDVHLARAALGRVRAERRSTEATLLAATGELKQLLAIEGDLQVEGTLSVTGSMDVPALTRAAAERPELRELSAALREAEAETRLAGTYKKPEVGIGARYEREEGANVVFGGVTIALPVFARGQELLAVSSARATRLRAELEAAKRRVEQEVETAVMVHDKKVEAVRVLETEALPGLDENERLTTRSFEVGQLGLTELLLIRRETLETRMQYVDVLLAAALARIELDATAAVLR